MPTPNHNDRSVVFSRKDISDCKQCPFRRHNRVYGGAFLPSLSKVALVAEAPGSDEDRKKMPFVGKAGLFLQQSAANAGMTWAMTYLTNVISCRPPSNNIHLPESAQAIRHCKAGFQKELLFAVEKGIRVFVALGQTALNAFDVTDASITKARGSVYEKMIGKTLVHVIPTYHPSYLIRGNMREESTFVTDLQKAQQVARDGWHLPTEDFIIEPTIDDVVLFVRQAEQEQATIACDIETAGGLGIDSYTKMIGFALNDSKALCVPVTKQGGNPYWSDSQWPIVVKYLQRLFKRPTIWQNCLFDVPRLRKDGFDIANILHDIMLLHHALYPELPHRLDYVVSTYGKTPYWKDARQMSFKAAEAMNDEEFRTYNLRDCIVLHQVLPSLLAEAEKENVLWAYQQNMSLVPVIEHIQSNGLLLDKDHLAVYKRELEEDIKKERTYITTLNVDKGLNLGSTQDKAYLFYGKKPPKYASSKEVLRTAKRTDTKKYAAAKKVVDSIDNTQPLTLPTTYRAGSTKSGGYSTDSLAIDGMFRSIRNRLAVLETLQRPTARHKEEEAALERSYNVLSSYANYQQLETQLGLYTDFPLDEGRVKGTYVIHGTSTGRLSSRRPNMQNIKKRAKDMFVATPGFVFIEGDYSNLELRVLAELSDDDVLRGVFTNNLNVHDENTKALFGLSEDDEMWDLARRAAKTYIFGRNYGGSLEGIYKKVSRQVPELKLTLKAFKEADQRYRQKHPAYDEWKARLLEAVKATRTLVNAFGRRRVFLGEYREVVREALNFPIQSTAADILNIALCKTLDNLPTWARIVLTVHDSIVLEVEEQRQNDGITFLRDRMEAAYTINNNDVRFPVEVHTGVRLGSLKKVAYDLLAV